MAMDFRRGSGCVNAGAMSRRRGWGFAALAVAAMGAGRAGEAAPLGIETFTTLPCELSRAQIEAKVAQQLEVDRGVLFGPAQAAIVRIRVRTSTAAGTTVQLDAALVGAKSEPRNLAFETCEELELTILLFVATRAFALANQGRTVVAAPASPRPDPDGPRTLGLTVGTAILTGPALPSPAPQVELGLRWRASPRWAFEVGGAVALAAATTPEVRAISYDLRVYSARALVCPWRVSDTVGFAEICAGPLLQVVDASRGQPVDQDRTSTAPGPRARLGGEARASFTLLLGPLAATSTLDGLGVGLAFSAGGAWPAIEYRAALDPDAAQTDLVFSASAPYVRASLSARYLF